MATLIGDMDVAEMLERIIKRIVEVADPERILLFGSAARGEVGRDSDIDVLVIKDGEFRRRSVARQIYRNLSGVGCPVDVVVVCPDDVQAYGNQVGSVIEPALREGQVIYERRKRQA